MSEEKNPVTAWDKVMTDTDPGFTHFFATFPGVLALVDAGGRIKKYNPVFSSYFRTPETSPVGEMLFTSVSRSERAAFIQFWNAHIAEAKSSFDLPVVNWVCGNSSFYMDGSVSAVPDAEGIYLLHLHDVSAMHKSIEALEAREKRYRMLLEQGNEFLLLLDGEGIYKYGSPALEKFLGYREAFTGTVVHCIAQGSRLPMLRVYRQALQNPGKPLRFELKVFRSDGSTVWVGGLLNNLLDLEGVNAMVANFRDITERKEAEALIRSSNERYEMVSMATHDVIWDWDIAHNRMYWSSGYVKQFGYKSETGRAGVRTWAKRIHPRDRSGVLRGIYQELKKKDSFYWESEYRYLRADGRTAYVYDRGYISRNAEGIPLRMVGALQNISQRKKAEAQVRRLNKLLERKVSERTAALEEANRELESFSYSVSHDLRAPLRAINGFAELLRKGYADALDEEGNFFLHTIKSNAVHMNGLIDDLLNLSRLGRASIQKTRVEMESMVREVEKELRASGPFENTKIQTGKLWQVPCDPVLIRQVWINLLSNALKYSSRSEHPIIRIGSEKRDQYIVYHVSDNGVGFDMEYADKLFGVFQRLHSSEEFEGTGIGLAIVSRVIRRHGGNVWAESSPGEGATFFFSLPVS